MLRSHLTFSASLIALMAALAGCAVGPDFEKPKAPDVASYTSTSLSNETVRTEDEAGGAQKFAPGEAIPAEWWNLFQSEPLNRLIRRAISRNPDLAAAQASLRAVQEDGDSRSSVLYPTLDASFDTTRQKSGNAFGGNRSAGIYTLHNASVDVSYGLDVWGGSRRFVEQLAAEEDYQLYQLEAAYLTLTSNVITAAIQEASLRGQIAATQRIIHEQQKALNLLNQQFEAGAVAKTSVLDQEAKLAQTRATLPDLEKQLSQTRHLLSVLAGDFPAVDPEGSFDLMNLKLPQKLPVTLPSQLVDQRPDIRAAEANLHAASAAIGVAESKRLPQIMLSANIGSIANNLGKLFTPGTGVWSMGATLTETLFDAGAKLHAQNAAEAQFDVAAAQYRKTVLTAFQNVADTLRALQADAETLKAQIASEHAANESLRLAQEQFNAGAVSAILLMNAQQSVQQARIGRVRAEAQRYADTAALFQALGGGWWNRKLDITQPVPEITISKTEEPSTNPNMSNPMPMISGAPQ